MMAGPPRARHGLAARPRGTVLTCGAGGAALCGCVDMMPRQGARVYAVATCSTAVVSMHSEISYRSGLQRGAARRSSYPDCLFGRESLMRRSLPAWTKAAGLHPANERQRRRGPRRPRRSSGQRAELDRCLRA
jgi:hypothetical protein